jgi:hypothetical protein
MPQDVQNGTGESHPPAQAKDRFGKALRLVIAVLRCNGHLKTAHARPTGNGVIEEHYAIPVFEFMLRFKQRRWCEWPLSCSSTLNDVADKI